MSMKMILQALHIAAVTNAYSAQKITNTRSRLEKQTITHKYTVGRRVKSASRRTGLKYKINKMLVSTGHCQTTTYRSPSPGRWATPPVVISISRTPAPRRGSATGAAALLAIGQLYPYPATTQCPVKTTNH